MWYFHRNPASKAESWMKRWTLPRPDMSASSETQDVYPAVLTPARPSRSLPRVVAPKCFTFVGYPGEPASTRLSIPKLGTQAMRHSALHRTTSSLSRSRSSLSGRYIDQRARIVSRRIDTRTVGQTSHVTRAQRVRTPCVSQTQYVS